MPDYKKGILNAGKKTDFLTQDNKRGFYEYKRTQTILFG